MSVTISNGTSTITAVGLIGFEYTRSTNTVTHPVIGRGDVDVSYNPAGLRSGTLTYLFGSYTAARAADVFYCATGGRFTYMNTDTGFIESGMVHVLNGNCVVSYTDDTNGTQWTVAVDFQEVV